MPYSDTCNPTNNGLIDWCWFCVVTSGVIRCVCGVTICKPYMRCVCASVSISGLWSDCPQPMHQLEWASDDRRTLDVGGNMSE